jgi:hypothetical protein
MNKVIIYPVVDNSLAVITPVLESGLTIEQIAAKDVPAQVPYLIVDRSELPADKTFRLAWQADFSNPHGHGIGQQAWFIQQYNAEISAINAEQAPSVMAAVAYEDATFPEGFSEKQKQEAYDQLVAYVADQNAQAAEKFEQLKAARIEQLNNMIAVQQAEMNA